MKKLVGNTNLYTYINQYVNIRNKEYLYTNSYLHVKFRR